MKRRLNVILIALILLSLGCHSNKKIQNDETEQDYIFFLHNKFLEDNPDGTFAEDYGVKVEYEKILQSFRKDGFIVFSEKESRKPMGLLTLKK